jgi:ubiquinone/menaquinone biosynthesis C-methylase UbiE
MPESSEQHPYDRHVGRYGQDLARGLIDFAGVVQGRGVVDVGCGTGQLTAELAAVVGGENVAAVDVSEAVLSVCRARVPDADARAASAEALPFADREFDAALAQLVVNLVNDPPGAVREMTRVVRPGGVVAACFWDDTEMPLLRSLWDSVRAVAPERLAGTDEQTQVGVADLEVIRDWWTAADLREISLGELVVSAEYESFDDLWAPFESGVGNSGKTYLSLPEEQRAAVRAEAYKRLGSPKGEFQLTAKARTVRGIR